MANDLERFEAVDSRAIGTYGIRKWRAWYARKALPFQLALMVL